MRHLLDTHTLLWAMEDHPRLSPRARALLVAPEDAILMSVASAWEMAIKQSLGKLRLSAPVAQVVPERLIANGITLLPIHLTHIGKLETLPFHHRDPFDRMLAAQALAEGLAIVSADEAFDAYGVARVW